MATDTKSSRRKFFRQASTLGLAALPLSLAAENVQTTGKLNILCVGAHPDDPESGCGGTLAKFAAAGHNVKIAYLTRGEAGIEGKSHSEAAAIRTKEAEAACKLLNTKAAFLGQIDGDTQVNNEWINKVNEFIQNEKADIVFTHWPIDEHKDHQAASLLTIQAWVRAKKKFQLYFFEVCLGEQTMTFHPTDYVDISSQQEIKRKAVFCHTSQDPASIYTCGHDVMEKFRGKEIGVTAAEAFMSANGRNSPTIDIL